MSGAPLHMTRPVPRKRFSKDWREGRDLGFADVCAGIDSEKRRFWPRRTAAFTVMWHHIDSPAMPGGQIWTRKGHCPLEARGRPSCCPALEKRMRMPGPVSTFVALSLSFGTLLVFATPPLRGPDETAHFLRAYGVARGDVVPAVVDRANRKGVLLPKALHDGFDFFEGVRVKEKQEGFGYRPVIEAYVERPKAGDPSGVPERFVPYAGSEGYSPVAYLPHAAAAFISRALDLGFLPTLYAMRFAGLALMTAVIALAVAIVPNVGWAFFAIAMLPSALYGRSVISADGMALSASMLVTALWLRAICGAPLISPVQQSVLMTINALCKPPNLAFVLLELRHLWATKHRWRMLAVAALPAIAAAVLWTLSSGADTAAWRMVEITGRHPDAFDPFLKAGRLLSEPLRFPAAILNAWREHGVGELWRQLIGVLGLFDTVLLSWVYPVLSLLLAATFLSPLSLPAADRRRVVILAAATAFAYGLIVYLISYLAFTPHDVDVVWGVQGRYFVPILSLFAIVVAAVLPWPLSDRLRAAMAIALAILSGCASVEAHLRVDWLAG
jgi:hypothetical protein